MSRQPHCADSRWSVGSTSGHGIPHGMAIVNVSRHYDRKQTKSGRYIIARGQLDGLLLPRTVIDALMVEYGYCHLYSRNSCGFVMSRAARRRGMTTNNWRYLSMQSRGKVGA